MWHCFSPQLLCDGSPGSASLSGSLHRDLCYCPFPRCHGILCLGVTNHGPRLCRATGSLVLPPNSSYPPHTTEENIWGHLGGWVVKLSYFFTGLAGWTGSVDCPLSTRIRETTEACGREQGEQKEWGGRDGSKLVDQLYHQTVPEYPLCKHIPYCCWRQVPG